MALLLAVPQIRSPSQWPGDRPVGDVGGPFADHDHGLAEPGSAPAVALWLALGPALPHGAFQLLLEFAPGLQVDGW